MRVVKSCVLELREYKGKRIVCQLNLDSPYNDGIDFGETQDFRWLEKKHWQTFDAQLEQIVQNLPDKSRIGSEEIPYKSFQLNGEVSVQVTKSSAAVKTLLECLGHFSLEYKDNTLALDFLFLRRSRKNECTPKKDTYSPCHSTAEDLEYLPQPLSSNNTSADSSCLLYIPSNSGKCDLGSDDPDRYSPKLELSPSVSPVYKPRPIQKNNDSASKEKDIFTCSSDDDVDDIAKSKKRKASSTECQDTEINSKRDKEGRTRRQHHRHKDNDNREREVIKTANQEPDFRPSESTAESIPISTSHDDNIDLMEYIKPKKEKQSKHAEEKRKQETENKSKSKSTQKHSSSKDFKIKENAVQNNELRRSNRSPVKPKRYEEANIESSKNINANKKRKEIMKKCFGSDAESDDFVEKTPVKPVPKAQLESAHQSSSVKKRKREDKNQRSCQQEKQSMSKWLSKKKPEELVKSPKKASNTSKSRSKETKASETKTTSNIVKRIVYPTPEEIAENERRENAQMRANENMKHILKDLIQVPKKVEILSLNDMSADEILKSFTKYKAHLDDVFHKLRSKSKVTGYNGINHYSVIELIDHNKQLKMMQKLGEVYEKDIEGTSLYSTLFANALMPEWLVHIFKDKFNLSHNEAVSRLDEQRQYMQYMDIEDH